MGPLRIALSLLRVPRLFISLFLFPLLIGLVVVVGHLLVTGLILSEYNGAYLSNDANGENAQGEQKAPEVRHAIFKRIIFGDHPLTELKVCRWIMRAGREIPPSPECAPSRLDAALRSPNSETIQYSDYAKVFEGNVERLHLCRTCTPDITIDLDGSSPRLTIRSAWASYIMHFVMLGMAMDSREVLAQQKEFKGNLMGDAYLSLPGLTKAARITGSQNLLAIVLNVSALIVISLWLALKAHRKILDYFATNGALLPMVAATGHSNFYTALWILTIFRVSAFVLASIPLIGVTLHALMNGDEFSLSSAISPKLFLLWLITISTSFALAAIMASVADLKHRYFVFSFLYRFAPLLLAFFGGFFWGISFLLESDVLIMVRNVITATPVLGMIPVLVFPVLQIPWTMLALHSVLACIGVIVIISRNSRWFAAHLEEL